MNNSSISPSFLRSGLATVALLAGTFLLSGCADGGPANILKQESAGLSEAEVIQIVEDVLAKNEGKSENFAQSASESEYVKKSEVDALIASKIVTESVGMTDEQFQEKVSAGIQTFIAEQEEAARKAQEEANKPKKIEGVSADDDPFIGDENAPVTIIEFSDFECPFCARHFTDVYPKIKEKYIDTGKVKYVFRDLPLDFHKNAIPAAVAANCVREQSDDETYFKFHDKLFANQKELTRSNFLSYAKELGVNDGEFLACLDKNDASEIDFDAKQGAEYGVSGTPGFFINGWQIKGAFPYETFEELIEQELNK